jgi:hypothetical protein
MCRSRVGASAAVLPVVALGLALASVTVALAGGVAAAHGINHLGAAPQASADGLVRMESAFATEDGFVVVYRDREGGEERGEVLAHRPFSASTRDVHDVPVRIPSGTWRDLPTNATLRAVLHGDDGDGEFDPATDPPLASFGGVAAESFVVRRGPTAYVGASSGGDIQRSADGVVEVRSVHLPERGHLVLRNSSGGRPAEVVGTTALGAGNHTNVPIELDGSFFDDRPTGSTFSVWAHAYVDDGDGTFDADDRSIRAGNETVGTRFGVERAVPGRTPTPTPEEGAIVRTAPPSTAATGTPAPTSTSAGGSSPTANQSPTGGTGSAGAGIGFGLPVALVALALVALVLRRDG